MLRKKIWGYFRFAIVRENIQIRARSAALAPTSAPCGKNILLEIPTPCGSVLLNVFFKIRHLFIKYWCFRSKINAEEVGIEIGTSAYKS